MLETTLTREQLIPYDENSKKSSFYCYKNELAEIDNSDVGMKIIDDADAMRLLKVGFKLAEVLKSAIDTVKVELVYQRLANSESGEAQSEPLVLEYETGVWQS